MAKAKIIGHPWDFCVLWNDALRSVPEKPLVKREHCWASELGGSYVDRYLRMHAVPYTNPPNERSRRKFLVGHIFEWIVGMVMVTTGILQKRQVRAEVEIPGLLRVTGNLDFIAGGEIDWEKSQYEIDKLKLLFSQSYDDAPAFITHSIDYIFKVITKQFKNKPLQEVVFECKSISSRMFERIQKAGAMPHHVLQSGHYLLGSKIPIAKIGYISKDDCLMEGFDVDNSRKLAAAYRDDVQMMTNYFNATNRKNPLRSLPPKQSEILFDEVLYRFEKNFKVEYSPYLEMLYGYKTPEEYRDKWTKQVGAWNRGFKNVVKGKNVRDTTKQSLAELKKLFPDLDKYIEKAKREGVFVNEQEEE